jgi:chaperonin GroES
MAYSAGYGAPDEGVSEKGMAKAQPDRSFRLTDLPEVGNIAEILDKDMLDDIGQRVYTEYKIDCDSRDDKVKEWDEAGKAFKLERQPKSYPFQNASNVKSPILLEAAIQFSSRATPALVHDGRVAKGKVEGDDPEGLKAAMADRVANYLNYQILVKNTVWQAQTEKMLLQAPIYGNGFKKVYRDPVRGTVSDLISPYQFIVNACYLDLEQAPRYSYEFDLYPYQVEERKRDGRWLDVDLSHTADDDKQGDQQTKPEYDLTDPSSPQCFIEQFRREDLDDDGYDEPYFVTIHKTSRVVVRMTTAYDLQDIHLKTEHGVLSAGQIPPQLLANYPVVRVDRSPDNTYINYEFIPDPTGHAYGIGFGKLLGDITETINTTINQILDAGNLQNAGGGFIGREFRLKGGALKQEIGLWKQVAFAGDDIRKAMVKFDHPGPSPVLFNMLGLLQEWTKKITSTSEVLAGEATPNQPATTTLALIEQGLKVFTGIISRMLRALGQELRAYYALNARFASEEQNRYAMVGDTPQYIARQDFNPDACDVVPVADSTVVTDAQAMARAEMIMQVAATPIGQSLMDPAEVLRRYLQAARIPVEGLIKGPDPQAQQMQMEAQMLQIEELRAKVEKLYSEAQKNLAQAGTEGQDLEMKMQEMQLDGEMKAQELEMEMVGKQMDMDMKREEHALDMDMKVQDHNLQREMQQDNHQMQSAIKAQDALLGLEVKREQGKAAIAQQKETAEAKAKVAAKSKPNGGSR